MNNTRCKLVVSGYLETEVTFQGVGTVLNSTNIDSSNLTITEDEAPC